MSEKISPFEGAAEDSSTMVAVNTIEFFAKSPDPAVALVWTAQQREIEGLGLEPGRFALRLIDEILWEEEHAPAIDVVKRVTAKVAEMKVKGRFS